MPYVEIRRACQSRICYKSHSHLTFSIGAIDQGESHFNSFFAPARQLSAGSVVVIPAHIEHSCNPVPHQAWSYQMMHLDQAWVEQLFKELVLDFEKIQRSDMPLPSLSPYISNEISVYQTFTALNQDLFDDKFAIEAKQQKLIQVLTEILFPNFEFKNLVLSDYFHPYLHRMLKKMQSENSFVGLDELASSVGISRYAVIRLFKNNFGLTPHAYQINQKVQQARAQLKLGLPLVDIALTLGFSDQSHFQHAFKAYTGITPKRYQQQFKKH